MFTWMWLCLSVHAGSEADLKKNDRRMFRSHASCRPGLALKEGQEYLITGPITDVWHTESSSNRWVALNIEKERVFFSFTLHSSLTFSLSGTRMCCISTRGLSAGRLRLNVSVNPLWRLNVLNWRVSQQEWQREAVRDVPQMLFCKH